MIEKIVLDYLKAYTLINVPVFMEIPEKPPKSYITLEKISAGRKDKISACTFSVEAYADTLFKAVELSEKVQLAMEELGEVSTLVYSCRLGGENNNTDTTNKKYRYETVWNIFY